MMHWNVFNRLIHTTLSALSIISKSSIFSPPCFFSLMMVLLLTFAGLPSQIKLKDILLISFTKCFGMESTDALYMSLDKPKVLSKNYIYPSQESEFSSLPANESFL